MEMSIRFPGLDLVLSYVPRSFQVFGMEFTIYGVLIAIGALLGMGLVTLEAKRSGEDQNKYLDMTIISLLFSVVGSRLFYVAFSWELYKGNLNEILDFRNGGYAFYGGLLAGCCAAAVFCKLAKMSFWRAADIASLGILLGQIIGRWGNFFNRESFGEYADFPWVMQLPLSAVRSGEVSGNMRDNLLTVDGISYIQVQPVFLYESLWCLILLLLLLALRRKKRFEGELFMIYLAGYGLGRFFFEWLRTDKLYIPGTKLGISLIISAALFIICTPVVIVRGVMTQKRDAIRRRRRKRFLLDEIRKKENEEQKDTSEVSTELKIKAQSGTDKEVSLLKLNKEHLNADIDENTDISKNAESETKMQADADRNQEIQNLPEEQKQDVQSIPSEINDQLEKNKNADKKETQTKVAEKKSEDSDENVNWENSEYAHIPEEWRQHVGNSPTNSKEDV